MNESNKMSVGEKSSAEKSSAEKTLAGRMVKGAIFSGATFDSRKVKPGMLFVALKGDKADGHDYIAGSGKGCSRNLTAEHKRANLLYTLL